MYNNHLIYGTGEGFSGELHAINSIRYASDRGIQVKLAAIITGLLRIWEVQMQVAERLICVLAERHTHHTLHRQRFGLALFAFEKQLADNRQIVRSAGMRIIMRLAGPQCILIKLQPLVFDTAEDHRSKATVSNGQGLSPFYRRLNVPQSRHIFCRPEIPRGGPGNYYGSYHQKNRKNTRKEFFIGH